MEDDELDSWISYTGDAETTCTAAVSEVILPFDMSAQQFLEAARKRLADGSDDVQAVDALTNAKRALDCRLEELLFAFALLSQAKRQGWSVPRKLEVLSELALPAPRLLRKVNWFRNVVEHEFRAPNPDLVVDFVDAVGLFLESTWWYLSQFADQAEFENDDVQEHWWSIKLDRDAEELQIRVFATGGGEVSSAAVAVSHRWYMRFLRAYLATLFGRQWLLKTWTWD